MIDDKSITLGYELSFTKYFYKPANLRNAEEIIADIKRIEIRTDGLLSSIIGGVSNVENPMINTNQQTYHGLNMCQATGLS